jgi:Dolichyl-phosphate-mannose-protein mannosyltransferase
MEIHPEQRRSISTGENVFAWANAHALQIAFGAYCVVGLLFVFFGNPNRDEGWYLYASRLVYEGKIPYKDFPYFQMPLLPYVYGLPQLLFGPSLLVGRLTSFALSLITIGVGMHLARRIAGRTGALVFVGLTVVSLPVIWCYTTVRTEPMVTPLVMLSLFFLVKERRNTSDLVLAPSLLLWATATRLTLAPAFITVLAFCLYQARKNRNQWDTILVATGLQVVLFVVVPLVLTQDRMVFNVWTSQEFRGGQFRELQLPLGSLLRDKALFYSLFHTVYPLAAIAALAATIYLVALWRDGWRPSLSNLSEHPTSSLAMLALAGLVFLPHLAFSMIHMVYFTMAFALLTLMASITVVKAMANVPRAASIAVPSLMGGLLVIGGFSAARDFPGWIDTVNPSLNDYSNVGSYLKSVLPADQQILTFDATLAIEADRDVGAGLEMSNVSYWPALRTDRAKRYRVVDYELLQQIAADRKTGAIVISGWDIYQIMRGMTTLPEADPQAREQAILSLFPRSANEYRLARIFPDHNFGGGDYYVFLRNE